MIDYHNIDKMSILIEQIKSTGWVVPSNAFFELHSSYVLAALGVYLNSVTLFNK